MNPSLETMFSRVKIRRTRLQSWLRWRRKKKDLDLEATAIGMFMAFAELPPAILAVRNRNHRLQLKMALLEQRKKSKCF